MSLDNAFALIEGHPRILQLQRIRVVAGLSSFGDHGTRRIELLTRLCERWGTRPPAGTRRLARSGSITCRTLNQDGPHKYLLIIFTLRREPVRCGLLAVEFPAFRGAKDGHRTRFPGNEATNPEFQVSNRQNV